MWPAAWPAAWGESAGRIADDIDTATTPTPITSTASVDLMVTATLGRGSVGSGNRA